ncbi:MAG: phage terminase large subunit family protein [Planctomycetes bacterium]|nr:phage terminase large subunit family protein [Planctomycetota bacterium]
MDVCENDLLFEDFPEACVAFRHLEGRHQRCKSQEFEGQLTHIACDGEHIVLPSIRLSTEQASDLGIPIDDRGYTRCSGGIISAQGLLSAARGLKHKRPDGTQQRPDFAIIDDPETDRSADSPAEIGKRLKTIRKAIIPLAGQRKKLALIVNGTTITDGGVMVQLLDPKISPGWQGRRIPMLLTRATNEELWTEQYGSLLMTWDREGGDAAQAAARQRALEFYLANRDEMDEGAEATWHTCFSADQSEVSAIQHAYNVMLEQGEDVFDSECQQAPKRVGASDDALQLSAIISKATGLPRRTVPLWANSVTVFTDVQDDALFWLALASGEGFKTHVLDYGIFPEQHSGSLAYGGVKIRLRDLYPGNMEAALQAGLDDLIPRLKETPWIREEDHVQLMPTFVAADSSDNSTIVYGAVRRAKCIPTKGRYVGAKSVPWEEFPKREGEEISREYHWLMATTRGSGELRVLSYDTNWWKTFVTRRLRTAAGDAGSLTFFGKPSEHVQLAEHILAEYGVEVAVKTRKVEEWSMRPGQKENHLWDCLVGAHVLAAKAGATLRGLETTKRPRRPARQGPIEATYL